MKTMKTKFTFLKNIRKILVVLFILIFLMTGGCYRISNIILPDVVAPNSEFNVKICVEPEGGYEVTDYVRGIGLLGILLPKGWTVKESPKYTVNSYAKEYAINYYVKGYFNYSLDAVNFLENSAGLPPLGYYWWGAKSPDLIDILQMNQGEIDLTILTGETPGEYKMQFFLGDDTFWYKAKGALFGIKEKSALLPLNVVTSANSWENEEWEVYPNPSKGLINIRLGNMSEEVRMKVYDLNGKLQKSGILMESLNKVDLSALSEGTYIVSLEKGGDVKTKKLIIQ